MLDYTVPQEQVEALAAHIYGDETGYPGEPDRFENSIYKKQWTALAKRLIDSPEFQDIARTIQLTTIDQVERMASEQGDYEYALWVAREVAQGRSVDVDAE